MPIDKEELRRAVDSFSDDDFVTAQEILSNQLQTRRNEFLKDKLKLKNNLSFDSEEE